MRESGTNVPRVVVVTRTTEYDALVAQHGTHGQAAFFLETRNRSIGVVFHRHELQEDALQTVSSGVPVSWRRTSVLRSELDRFLFEPDDVVVAVGQDGLVANVAKYLEGQPVIGVNTDRDAYDGVLVKHSAENAVARLEPTARGNAAVEERTMVEAELDDGSKLCALNEIFVGHGSHQSARYRIRRGMEEERQSSSGVIVASGTGSTGWARSIRRQRADCELPLPSPTSPRLSFFVREAFPSVSTGCKVTEGLLEDGEKLTVLSEMERGGVVFGDGMESDRVEFNWGRTLRIRRSPQVLKLVR